MVAACDDEKCRVEGVFRPDEDPEQDKNEISKQYIWVGDSAESQDPEGIWIDIH
jgi:hypothetical protein